ncbi:MAG: chemotaxis protein MotA [Solirubrobacteraceae bacterium]|jgi:chemotaxis protein MotA|nr:chemotaxis protein MotA [Solirubrobacteraceae bacterium]
MKASSAIGWAVAFGGLLMGATMEGAPIMAVLSPSAMMIVLGGTLGVTIVGTSLDRIKAIPKLYKKILGPESHNLRERVAELVGFAEKARRDGLLALDDELNTVEDDFMRRGLQLVVDGTDPEIVADVLDSEVEAMARRHAAGAQPFEKAGGFAPTMGIIGTVFGLVHVLENLDKPATLGPAISAAFIATLLGVGIANVVFLPAANRLKQLSTEEREFRMLTTEGILGIQAGDNPRVLADKLLTFVPPSEREVKDAAPAPAGDDAEPATPAAARAAA